MNADNKHKVVVIGDATVGKTSLLQRLISGTFQSRYIPTVVTGHGTWVSEFEVVLQIWDTAGQERYRSLGDIFYQNAEAAIVVFDRTNTDSINSLKYWVDQFQAVAGKSPFIAVVASKSDIEVDSDPMRLAVTWAVENQFLFVDTSALTGSGVRELFELVAAAVHKRQEVKPFAINQESYISLMNLKKGSYCC
jgi:small GTP-binding protein